MNKVLIDNFFLLLVISWLLGKHTQDVQLFYGSKNLSYTIVTWKTFIVLFYAGSSALLAVEDSLR